jgi:GT2 family glycosyltransferase
MSLAMKPDEQRHLAGILADSAKRLQDDVAQLRRAGAGAPGDPDGHAEQERLIASLDAIARRVLDVDHALREDVDVSRRRSLATAARQWTSPRLGILRHYPPEQMRLPSGYLRVDPPRDGPTISIVTPSYEQGRYLARTIYSVLSQNYPRLEYRVQDGGSSDETRAVLERFDGSLSGWAIEPDDGQADAINRGFAHTGGEIMAYLNSDDLLLPGSLAYVARYFAKHPDVDAVYGHRIMIDEYDSEVGRWVLPPHADDVLAVVDYVPQETLFWRRELWERAGARIDASLQFAIDWDLLLRFRDAGARMVRLPRFLGAFRVHDEQKTGRQQQLCDSESELLRRRVLGRAMSEQEVAARARPYLRRHVLHHTIQRLQARLPLPRSNIRTLAPGDDKVSSFDLR